MLATTTGCIVASMETIGSRIAAAREKKGLNQSELGRLLNVTPQSVQAWESDKNVPRHQRLKDIADALGVSVPSLIGADDLVLDQSPGAGKTRSALDLVQEMLATRAGKALSEESRESLLAAAKENGNPPSQPTSNVITADFSRSTVVRGDTIVIAQYDVRAAMGAGQLPADYREFVRNLVVDKVELDDLGLKYTSPTNLKIISGWGESMRGTIEDKSPLIVDIGVTEFVDEGVYVFTWLGHLFIKRVQLLDAEHFQIVSDNKVFEPQKARMEDMYFQARVLGAWNFKKL